MHNQHSTLIHGGNEILRRCRRHVDDGMGAALVTLGGLVVLLGKYKQSWLLYCFEGESEGGRKFATGFFLLEHLHHFHILRR